jgi:hypothetical protein
MAMPQLTLRAKLSLLAALLALFGVFALAWQLRRQYNQRAVAACGQLRSEIGTLKRGEFDVRLKEMRTIRLNPAAADGQLVDQVAQVADRLGEKVDQFQRQGCVDLGPGP